MALEQKLRLKLAQRLVMTPSLQQAIKLLQLSRLELEETLSQEILENPILDVEDQREDLTTSRTDSRSAARPRHRVGDGRRTDERGPGDRRRGRRRTRTPLPSAEETYDDIDVEAFFADYLADSRPEGPSMVNSDRDRRSCRSRTSSPPRRACTTICCGSCT